MSTMPPSTFIAYAQEDTWTTLASMPTPRRELGLAVVEDKIYAIGGYNGTSLNVNEEYDPTTNTWTTKAPMPTARHSFAIVVYEDKIHVISGYTNSDPPGTTSHQVYDPTTDTWETKKSANVRLSGFQGNIVDNVAYFVSGTTYWSPPWINTDLNMAYNFTTETWSEKTPITIAVFRYASAVLDNEIFVVGGYQIGMKGYDLNQIYNPKSDSWRVGSPIPIAISGAGCVATTGAFGPRRIYIFGGFETPLGYSGSETDSNHVYDSYTDQWSIGASLPSSRSLFNVVDVDGELYAIGGYDGTNFLSINQKYTPIGYGTSDPNYIPPTPTISPSSTPTSSPEIADVEFPVLIVASIIIIILCSIGVMTYIVRTKRRS